MVRNFLAGVLTAVIFVIAAFVFVLAFSSAQPQYEPNIHNEPPDTSLVELVDVAEDMLVPIDVVNAGDGSNRLFVAGQRGTISIIENDELQEGFFLDITDRVTDIDPSFSEQGLLGLAFHPDYENNGRFFVNYTDENGDTIISEFRVSEDDPNRADPDTERQLIFLEQPWINHNGARMSFGIDGYLYVAMGDGALTEIADPFWHGQNPKTLYGAIWRLDVDNGDPYGIPPDNPFVDGEDGAPEVWSYGFRNPVYFSFDRKNNDLYQPDVGNSRYEEINFIPGGDAGGMNFGWKAFEADQRFDKLVPEPEDPVFPVIVYPHDQRCAVIGGAVYRGEAIPEYDGYYIYSDWCGREIFYAYMDEAGEWHTDSLLPIEHVVTAINESEDGELYITYGYGEVPGGVKKIVPVNQND